MSWAAVVLALVGRVVFSFVDPSITESSGLVDLGDAMVTTNDSGGDAVLYTVDATSGRTIGRTTYAREVEDVEALAPGNGPSAGVVWAADIGDNDERRESVRVYAVSPRLGDTTDDAPSYELVYPDGAHDAESLVVDRRGRLFVISKGLLGGTVYAAPPHLDPGRPNRMTALAEVGVWATDAALFPDGDHVLVRGYDTAVIYTFPAFRPVASLDLPRQKQGEGVSIGASGRIRLSSEGRNSAVLEVALPDEVTRAMTGATASPSASPDTEPGPTGTGSADSPDGGDHGAPRWLLVAGVVGLVGSTVALGLLALGRMRRPRR
jgi:hypothetical protein